MPFGYLSAPSLTSAFMGMGNMKVMMLYRKARRLAREYGACVLFIDEIDAIGMARSSSMMGGGSGANGALAGGQNNVMGMGMGMGAGSGLLNELLIQMDPPAARAEPVGQGPALLRPALEETGRDAAHPDDGRDQPGRDA